MQFRFTADNPSSTSRQIVVSSGAGILVLGLVIAVVGMVPLFNLLVQEQQQRIAAQTALTAQTVDLYLQRITDVAVQIASRTRAREQLEAYNQGRMTREALVSRSVPILSDAMEANRWVEGITRVDPMGNPVISIGRNVPAADWPPEDVTAEMPTIAGPYPQDGRDLLLVFAPIRDRQGKRDGTDVLALNTLELRAILARQLESIPAGRIHVVGFSGTDVEPILSLPENDPLQGRDLQFLQKAAREGALSRVNGATVLDYPESLLNGQLIGMQKLRGAGWYLALSLERGEVYLPIYRRIGLTFALFVVLVLAGTASLMYVLIPLRHRVEQVTGELRNEVGERKQIEATLVARLAQQAAVAELGRLALSGVGLQVLFDKAVHSTAETLDAEFCKVLELDVDRGLCILRAGVGWHEGLVGHAEVDIGSTSQAGYTLHSRRPVIVSNLAKETRFSGPALLSEHGVVSGVSVAIGHRVPWGVLGVHSRSEREFTQDDVNFLQAVANTLAEAIERSEAERVLRAGESRYRILFDENPSMLFTIDRDGRIVTVNYSGADQLGYRVKELQGTPLSRLIFDQDRETAARHLEDCFAVPDEVHRWELRKVRKDGSVLWVREAARVLDPIEGTGRIFLVCEDISEARLLSDQLSYQASHDPLTGLLNRREFELRLARLLASVRQENAEHALCYLDLDQFKVVNDTCGHVAGDQLLIQLANLIGRRVRRQDTFARLGGDEFGILMEYCGLEQAGRVAASILSEIESFRFVWEDHVFAVGASLGLVPIHETSGSVDDLMRNADSACYVAKDAGRNRIHIYEEHDVDIARWHGEMQWVSRLSEALDDDLFRLFAQPIISLDPKDEGHRHHEILIRLADRNDELITPGNFLPAAERYNLATRIDHWVIEHLFGLLRNDKAIRERLGICSINLSGQSVADLEFCEFVVDQLKTDIDPRTICFEITETSAIANLSRAQHFMQRLGALGCSFALDDFGSGLSSFAYLKSLPVNYLKIDGIFVKDIISDPADLAMVKSIHEIGSALGKWTIAEFVENDAIRSRLVEIGVHYAQGYGIGRPLQIG